MGTRDDYVEATRYPEWQVALQNGNLWDLKNRCDDIMVLAPAKNTDHNNVFAYLEAFWGYLWPAACRTSVHRLESGV